MRRAYEPALADVLEPSRSVEYQPGQQTPSISIVGSIDGRPVPETGYAAPQVGPVHMVEDVLSVAAPVSPHFPSIMPALGLIAGKKTVVIPGTGIPVLVLHGPFAVRAALGISADELVVRPLPPLVPSMRLRREDISSIDIEHGHWYAFGRVVVCVRRVKGPALRLLSPPIQGVPDDGETLGRLLRAWWRARATC